MRRKRWSRTGKTHRNVFREWWQIYNGEFNSVQLLSVFIIFNGFPKSHGGKSPRHDNVTIVTNGLIS